MKMRCLSVFGFYMVQPKFAKKSEATVTNTLPLFYESLSLAGVISWASVAYPTVVFFILEDAAG